MKVIAYLTFATTTFMLVAALAPNFVATVVGLPPGEIGYLVAPAGLGVIAGVVLVPRLSRRFRRDALIDWSIVAGGFSLLVLALSRHLLSLLMGAGGVPRMLEIGVAGFLAAVLGICNAFVLVPSQTILQERSHEHIRARVYGTFFTITSVVSFIPIFFAAAAADLFGVVTVLAGVAILLMAVGASSLIRTRSQMQQRYQRVRTRHRQGPEAVPPAG
jgi:MFS family permease